MKVAGDHPGLVIWMEFYLLGPDEVDRVLISVNLSTFMLDPCLV